MATSIDVSAPASTGAAGPPTLPGQQAPAEQDAPHLPWKRATGIVLVILGLIGMGELSRLLSSALVEAEGALQSRSPGELGAFTMLGNLDRWDHWEAAAGAQPGVKGWLALYVLFDLVFVAGYGGLLWLFLRRRQPRWRRRFVRALVVVELVENVLLLMSAAMLREGTWILLTGAAALASGIKWLLVAGVLIAVVAALRERGGSWAAVRGAGRSLRVHRLSVLMVVLLGALSLLPLPNLWDQFPDVLRGWFADTDDSGAHLAWGVVAYVVGAAAVFVLGRQRSERSWAALVGPGEGKGPIAPTVPPSYAWWIYGPLAALGTGLLLLVTVGTDAVDLRVWITLMAVPVVLVAASIIVREMARKQGRTLPREQVPAVPDRDQARRTWVTGDLLALSVLAIGALACIRALLVPVVLGGQAQVSRGATLVIAMVLVLGLFPVAAALLHALDTAVLDPRSRSRSAGLRLLLRPSEVVVLVEPSVTRSTDEPRSLGNRVARWFRELLVPHHGVVEDDDRPPVLGRASGLVTWLASIAFLVLVLLDPVSAAETLGVVGTTVLTLTAWTVALGYLIVHLQSQRPLEVFSLLHLRANPILTLLAVVALLASMFGGVEDHHALREDTEGTVRAADRDTLAERVAEWAGTPACTATLDVAGEDVVVRPMVLVAASGGGIRAAAWAAGVVDRLGGEDGTGCGAASVLLSSGVSGGSVGLVVARGSDPGAALDTVAGLAGESALSVALGGLLVGDLVAGVSGLLVPSASDDRRLWRDRAGLMESVWERDATVLGEPYDLEVTPPTGALVLNSTSATGCRVLISQLELEAPARERPWDDALCSGAEDDLPAGMDLWSVYRDCLPGMSWATAAMLSARFPTVTPAGWVPGDVDEAADECADLPAMQLIDGGYAESSGLGTLVDVAPSVVAAVAAHNARTTGDPVIVPVVLYLEDEPRTEIARGEEDPTPELFVPVVGRGAGGVQMSSSALLQRASAAYAHPCEGTDDGCGDAVEQLRAAVADGVVVAAPATRPAVQAPLGWTLSPDSRTQLDEGLRALLDEGARGVNGYGSFRDLLGVLSDASHAEDGSSDG